MSFGEKLSDAKYTLPVLRLLRPNSGPIQDILSYKPPSKTVFTYLSEINGNFRNGIFIQDGEIGEIREPLAFGSWQAMFLAAAKEAPQNREKILKGPHYDPVNAIHEQLHEELQQIDPALDLSALFPREYSSEETARSVRVAEQNHIKKLQLAAAGNFNTSASHQTRPLTLREQLLTIRHKKFGLMEDLYQSLKPQLLAADIERNLLEYPRYFYWQKSKRGCVRTCFLMVHSDIAGTAADPGSYEKSAKPSATADSLLIHNMQSEAFRSFSNSQVQVINLIGADLEYIGRTTEIIKNSITASKVYCIVHLLSDSGVTQAEDGVLHSNVLLYSTDGNVLVHDPAVIKGSPHRMIPKETFYHRWAQAQFRAHLIIAKPDNVR